MPEAEQHGGKQGAVAAGTQVVFLSNLECACEQSAKRWFSDEVVFFWIAIFEAGEDVFSQVSGWRSDEFQGLQYLLECRARVLIAGSRYPFKVGDGGAIEQA